MDEARKSAYRFLLYEAMLWIRTIEWFGIGWNPFRWRREIRRVRFAGALADWLHNLAVYSALDFRGFDEQWFWGNFETLQKKFPGCWPQRFADDFQQRMAATVSDGSVHRVVS